MLNLVGHRTGQQGGDKSVARERRIITLDEDDPVQNDDVRILNLLAAQVRSLYCICFREMTGEVEYGKKHMLAWDGDPEGISGKRTTNCWPRVAAFILAHDADPFEYVRAQFFGIKRATPPEPNKFTSDSALKIWEAFRDQTANEVQNRVVSDDNQIQIHTMPLIVNLKWDAAKALEYALRNQACSASPLVKYCHAVAANLSVASQFRERALLQYLFQLSSYNRVLGDRIPRELHEEATSLRVQVARHT